MISVIIPARNAERFIEESIRSALDCGADEVIVVDHASSDNTRSVASMFEPLKFVRMVSAEAGGGPARAKNVGFAASRGDLITFLDADDILTDLHDRAEALAPPPQKGGRYQAVFARIDDIIDGNGQRAQALGLRTWLIGAYNRVVDAVPADRVARGYLPGYATLMYRRELLEKVGPFDETLDRAEDFDMAYRCALVEPIGFVNRPCYLYRIHDANTSVVNVGSEVLPRPETRAAHRRALAKHGLL